PQEPLRPGADLLARVLVQFPGGSQSDAGFLILHQLPKLLAVAPLEERVEERSVVRTGLRRDQLFPRDRTFSPGSRGVVLSASAAAGARHPGQKPPHCPTVFFSHRLPPPPLPSRCPDEPGTPNRNWRRGPGFSTRQTMVFLVQRLRWRSPLPALLP